ncbi:putative fusion long tail fiber distal subunit [Vibrio phage phiKT1024]|nr:putative fusion long tail fiber distal subunit [Vibrio phage phiKT1024]
MANILYKNADKTVNTIAERNSISPKLDDMEVIVLDAIADIEAGPGAAVYKWSESINAWIMLANSKDEPLTSLSFSNDTLTYIDENGASTDIDLSTRYYSKTEVDSNFVNSSGDSMTGPLSAPGITSTQNLVSDGGIRSGTFHPVVGGGNYRHAVSSITGAINVTLPVGYTATMMRFFVDVFDYSTNKSFSVMVSGYTYSVASVWIVPTAIIIGDNSVQYPVRFGYDGSKCVVSIGDETENWSYPQVTVRDFMHGYDLNTDRWDDGWTVGIGTLPSKIDAILTPSLHAKTSESADAATTATTLLNARTISLTGDASGSVSFDGSGDVSIDVTVANDSHTHDTQYYTQTQVDVIENTIYGNVGVDTTTPYKATGRTFAGVDSTVDFDTLIQGGTYERLIGNANPNKPAGSTGYNYLQVFSYGSSGNATQIAIPYGLSGNNNGRLAYRSRFSSVWNDWDYIYSTANKPTPAELGVLPEDQGAIGIENPAFNTSATDWDTFIPETMSLTTTNVNSPTGSGAHGFFIPHQGSYGTIYGTQFVARDNNFYLRSRENDIWNAWEKILTDTYSPEIADVNGLQSALDDKLDSVAGVKGDMYVHNGTSFVKLNAGLDGQILYSDSTSATGLKWDYPTIG